MKKFHTVAIAGTFDRLHKGHRFFISEAFKLGEKVIIGLTSDKYVSKKSKIIPIKSGQKSPKYAYLASEASSLVPARGATSGQAKLKITEGDKDTSDGGPKGLLRGGGISKGRSPEIQSYQERERELKKFLREEDLLERAEIVKIHDVYGPAAESEDIEALLVTSETMEGARMVNKKRRLKHLKPLKILKIPLVLAEDKKRIASTRVRCGEIDRWGRVFLRSKFIPIKSGQKSKIQLSEDLRQTLKRPQGILIKGDPQNHQIVIPELKKQINRLQPTMISTVGDEVTKLCNQAVIPINLSIIDYKVRRKKIYHVLSDLGFSRGPLANGALTVKNPPGHITKTLVAAVKKSIRSYLTNGRQQIIKVIGEEDLSGVPAILLSPLGSVVLYGQPEEGIVIVEVTEKRKECLIDLIEHH